MTRRFRPQELFVLRNHVPVACLMAQLLQMPEKTIDGRFPCPVCTGSNTAINTAHNLLRCFDCRKNFNTIEIVMHHRKTDFVASVNYLKTHYRQTAAPADRPSNQPVAIGRILAAVMPAPPRQGTEQPADTPIADRLQRFEQKLDQIYQAIATLQDRIASL